MESNTSKMTKNENKMLNIQLGQTKRERITRKRMNNELLQINRTNSENLTKYSAEISDVNFFKWIVTVEGFDEAYFPNGKLKLFIEFPTTYPFEAPKVYFSKPIDLKFIRLQGPLPIDILSQQKWIYKFTIQNILFLAQSYVRSSILEIVPRKNFAQNDMMTVRAQYGIQEKTLPIYQATVCAR